MVVMILERVSSGLRGELSRWLLEPRAGVFVGNVSGLVRDRLWEKVEEETARKRTGAGILIQTARCEQGFRIRTIGDPTRTPVDWEGLTLIRIREPARKPAPTRSSGAEPPQGPVGTEPGEAGPTRDSAGRPPGAAPEAEDSSEASS